MTVLNLTGHHLVTPGAVYPASGAEPKQRLLRIPPAYPTPPEILADLGVPPEGIAALTGTPIRVAAILDGIDGFPDLPAGVGAVIVPHLIATSMRQLGLTVRRGVAVLSPWLQSYCIAAEAIRRAPAHAAAIWEIGGGLTWADTLVLFDDLTGMHDAPGLHRDTEHPADAAILRLMDETGTQYLRCESYHTVGAPPRMKMTAHLDRDVVQASGAGWAATMGALDDELRARGMLPPERQPENRANLLSAPAPGDACDAFTAQSVHADCRGDGHYLCRKCKRLDGGGR